MLDFAYRQQSDENKRQEEAVIRYQLNANSTPGTVRYLPVFPADA
jgi:hypothetical protein